MDVEPGGRISVLWILNPIQLGLIPWFGGVVEFLPVGRRMEPGRGDPKAVGIGVVCECRADCFE